MGLSKSCGCIRTELLATVQPGESFGRLTAVRKSEGRGGYWHFKCVCGNDHEAKLFEVRTGGIKSCGCLRDQRHLPSISVGDSFGNLTAVRSANGGNKIWIFKCTCGNECSPRLDRVVNGRVKSCGCLRLRDKDGPRRVGTESGTSRITRMFVSRKADARRRGIPFILSKLDVMSLAERQEWKCAQTGIAFGLSVGAGAKPFGPSIDRIDNALGYAPGNIQLVCIMYNYAKSAFADDDVFAFAEALVKHRQRLAINNLKLRIVV